MRAPLLKSKYSWERLDLSSQIISSFSVSTLIGLSIHLAEKNEPLVKSDKTRRKLAFIIAVAGAVVVVVLSAKMY